MRIYSQVRLGVSPEINAVCTLLIGLVAVGVVIWSLATRWQAGRDAAGVATPPTLRA